MTGVRGFPLRPFRRPAWRLPFETSSLSHTLPYILPNAGATRPSLEAPHLPMNPVVSAHRGQTTTKLVNKRTTS